ncbi:MAG: hypothetical protein K0S18_1306 [Anaerocolumna sp.]|jgi:hypothetical protein|nr:hypothetical protein [Anaerocolumna sp.]
MRYKRVGLEVEGVLYEVGKGLEDGFELFRDVVVNGWIVTDSLIQIKKPDGSIVCPYISNRRGRIYISLGDYIITESDGERHVCGGDKFSIRYEVLKDNL